MNQITASARAPSAPVADAMPKSAQQAHAEKAYALKMPAAGGDADFGALTVPELALGAGVGQSSVWLAIRKGKLRARKWGRRTLILIPDAKAYLNDLPLARPAA